MDNVGTRRVWAYLLAFVLLVSLSISIPIVKTESVSGSVVRIVSPTSSTYDSRLLLLNVTFTYGGLRYDLTYNLDGVTEGSIPMGEYRPPNNEVHLINTVYAWVNLRELSDGPHLVTVMLVAYVHYTGGGKPRAPFQPTSPGSSEYSASWSDTVQFNVDTGESYETITQPPIETPPEILNLSVHNQTYASPDVSLDFTLKGSTSRITYSLDAHENISIGGNTTLHGLSVGKHTLTVFCWDEVGNVGASETITFTIDKQPESSSNLEPVSGLPVAGVSVAVVGLVSMGIMVYLKKRTSVGRSQESLTKV